MEVSAEGEGVTAAESGTSTGRVVSELATAAEHARKHVREESWGRAGPGIDEGGGREENASSHGTIAETSRIRNRIEREGERVGRWTK